ncbi:dynein light chain type 1 family protein [Wolffia australiana]
MMAEERRRGGGDPAAIAFHKVSLDDGSSALPSSAPKRRIIVKSADMKEDVQKEAIDCAIAEQAFDKHSVEKDIAEYIKKEFDKAHGSTWHCIVGRNFGSYVTHETNHFIYFYLDQKAILLFKSG